MKTFMQKPAINAEAFMKFFEETTGAKFVDVKIGKPAYALKNKTRKQKSRKNERILEK